MNNRLRGLAAGRAHAASSASMAVELSFWSWRVEDKAFYDSVAKVQGRQRHRREVHALQEHHYLAGAVGRAGRRQRGTSSTRAYGALAALADADYLVPVNRFACPTWPAFGDGSWLGRGAKRAGDRTPRRALRDAVTGHLHTNDGCWPAPASPRNRGPGTSSRTSARQLKEKRIPYRQRQQGHPPGADVRRGRPNFYGGTEFFNAP